MSVGEFLALRLRRRVVQLVEEHHYTPEQIRRMTLQDIGRYFNKRFNMPKRKLPRA